MAPSATRLILAEIIIKTVKPYVRRELPGWGKVYSLFVGGYRRQALWAGVGTRNVTSKTNGLQMLLDLSKWADRLAYFLERWYDTETQAIVSATSKQGDTIVDVGANTGMFALCAVKAVGATGRVICFEPNPSCVAQLSDLIDINKLANVDVRPVGLSSSDGMLALAIPLINDGEATFGQTQYNNVTTVVVPVKVGDNELCGATPSLIKIDVEGFEVNVLRGLEKTLHRCRPVVVTEVYEDHLRRSGSSRTELDSVMKEFGYRGYEVEVIALSSEEKLRLKPARSSGSVFDAIWLPIERLPEFTHLM